MLAIEYTEEDSRAVAGTAIREVPVEGGALVVPQVHIDTISGVHCNDVRPIVVVEIPEAYGVVGGLRTPIAEYVDTIVVLRWTVEVEQLALKTAELVGTVAIRHCRQQRQS